MIKQWITLIFLLIISSNILAQKTITGTVMDENEDPIVGASISMKGSTEGTITNLDGEFSMNVTEDAIIVISSIGFESVEINTVGKSHFDAVLKENEQALDEIVVTGYQKIEKRKLTSSVAKIKTDDIMQSGVASIDQMLDGQLAGVQTTTVSGAPGAPAKIRIRGTVSLSGTQDPLWVVDGIPLEGTDLPDLTDKDVDVLYNSSVAGLNPDDIADITILKDAAATAIYGARAANGVIVITTKKGKAGKMNISLRANTSFVTKPNLEKLNLMNASEKIDMELNLAKYKDLLSYNKNVRKGAVGELLEEGKLWTSYQDNGFEALPTDVQKKINALRNINTNWGDELYQTAVNQEYGLSISGGNDKATYYFSTGYLTEKGTTVSTELDRLNFTFKGDYKLARNLRVGAAIFTNHRKNSSYLLNEGARTSPSRYSRMANPYQEIYDNNHNYVYDNNIDSYYDIVKFNIIEERENTHYKKKANSLYTVFNLDWEIIPKLNFRTQFGLQKDVSNREQYAHKNSFFARRERAGSRVGTEYVIPDGGVIKNWDSELNQWTLKNIFEYEFDISSMHEFNIMIGSELRRNSMTEVFSAGYGFNNNTLTTVPVIFPDATNAKSYPLFKKRFIENAFVSAYGTLGYTFNNKYIFFGSVRMDGSDLFGIDDKYRYQPLWSVSAAWRIKEEGFLQDVSFINNLKLRLSYGLQGNIDKGTSRFIIGERKTVTVLPGNSESAIVATNMPNDRLRWEKTKTYNAGLDLNVANNRIALSVDYYNRTSSDIIGPRAIPLENGLNVTSLNWAGMTNKGFEVTLSTLNINNNGFSWRTIINISKNINTIDQIYEREDQVTPSLMGHSANAMFALKTAGLDEQGYILFEKDGKKMNAEQFFKMVDPSGWGYYSSNLSKKEMRELYTFVGNSDPEFSGGFINTFSYKNFSLNISTSFNIGMWKKRQPFYNIIDMDRGYNRSKLMQQVWTPDNKSGIYPRMIGLTTEGGTRKADFMAMNTGIALPFSVFDNLDIWYEKFNIVRINSIRFSYSFSKTLLQKAGIVAAKINAEVRNPWVFGTDYEGYFDPESYGNIYAQPIPKTFTLGLNITF